MDIRDASRLPNEAIKKDLNRGESVLSVVVTSKPAAASASSAAGMAA